MRESERLSENEGELTAGEDIDNSRASGGRERVVANAEKMGEGWAGE